MLGLALVPFPALPGPAVAGLAWFAAPAVSAFAPLWSLDTSKELTFAALACWWAYASLLKWTVLFPARFLGLDAPAWGRGFVWLGPPWRPIYRLVVAPVAWWQRQVRPSSTPAAGWQSLPSILANFGAQRGGVPFARVVVGGVRGVELFHYAGQLGLLVLGQAGGGKTSTFQTVVGSATSDQSLLFTDVDGEVTRTLGGYLQDSGHALTVIELLAGATGFPAAVWNLFDELDSVADRANARGLNGHESVVPAIMKAADAVVQSTNQMQPVFDIRGRQILSALLAFVYRWAAPEDRTLRYVRSLLCNGLPVGEKDPKGTTPLDVLLFEMEDCVRRDDECGGMLNDLIRNGAATIRSGQSRDGSNPFLGAAIGATAGWDLPAIIHATTGRSTFRLADHKTGNAATAIVCAVGDMATTYAPFIRLLYAMYLHVFETMPRCRKSPAIAICDEAQNTGDVLLARSQAHVRKHECIVIVGAQDLQGLQVAFPKHWQSMWANSGGVCVLPTTDKGTLAAVHGRLGQHTVRVKVEGTPWWLRLVTPRGQHVRASYRQEIRDLKDPAALADLLAPGRGRMVVLGLGRPFIAGVAEYWKVLPVSRYAPSTYVESLGRALTRRFLTWRQERRGAFALPPAPQKQEMP